jgi:hypothetical protein
VKTGAENGKTSGVGEMGGGRAGEVGRTGWVEGPVDDFISLLFLPIRSRRFSVSINSR